MRCSLWGGGSRIRRYLGFGLHYAEPRVSDYGVFMGAPTGVQPPERLPFNLSILSLLPRSCRRSMLAKCLRTAGIPVLLGAAGPILQRREALSYLRNWEHRASGLGNTKEGSQERKQERNVRISLTLIECAVPCVIKIVAQQRMRIRRNFGSGRGSEVAGNFGEADVC